MSVSDFIQSDLLGGRHHHYHGVYPEQGRHTFEGLHDWYKHLFCEYGWMALAAHHGRANALKHYKERLTVFLLEVEEGMHRYTERDRVHDLETMHENAEVLLPGVDALLALSEGVKREVLSERAGLAMAGRHQPLIGSAPAAYGRREPIYSSKGPEYGEEGCPLEAEVPEYGLAAYPAHHTSD